MLDSYQILDSEPDESFELLCRLAAKVCESAYSAINILDDRRQWSLASFGGLARERPRAGLFCNDTVTAGVPLVIPATAEDERYAMLPGVASAPWIQAYAGVPLTVQGDVILGTICVLDVRPRPFDAAQLEILRGLAGQASALLELRRLRMLLLLLAPLVTEDRARSADTAASSAGGLDARGVWALQQLLRTGAGADDEALGTRTDLLTAPGLSGLTNRELEIVARLLAGDRVPVIAERLFLSQSTVRNHLSSAFAKLGVESQQETIDLLRRTSSALFRRADPGTGPTTPQAVSKSDDPSTDRPRSTPGG